MASEARPGDASHSGAARVTRRRVFYIPGYDPFPPRRYRELYRTESAAQAAASGYRIGIRPLTGGTGYGWEVEASDDGWACSARIEVLVWSDIVRQSMSRGLCATYVQLVNTLWCYLGSGALLRLMRLCKEPMIAALYPFVVLLLELVVAGLLGWGAASLVGQLPVFGLQAAVLGGVARIAAGLAVVWMVLWLFRWADRRVYAWYLMHDYAFTAAGAGAVAPALETRIAEFAARIAGALSEGWDEVLVVGHSSGVHLGISVMADLVRTGRVPANGPALGFLSLGHVVPMVSFLPKAGRLRADLALLSQQAGVAWVDVTAPGDGCAFALCDPVAVSGMAGPGKRWPLVLSAAFSQTLSPERLQALRRRYLRLHFQYMCAFDRPGDYDYFLITAGPETLAARFSGRAASKSRIERPLNRYGAIR